MERNKQSTSVRETFPKLLLLNGDRAMKLRIGNITIFATIIFLSLLGCSELPRSYPLIPKPDKVPSDTAIDANVKILFDSRLYDGFKDDLIDFVEKMKFFKSYSIGYTGDKVHYPLIVNEYRIKLDFYEKSGDRSFADKSFDILKVIASGTTFGIVPMPFPKYYEMRGLLFDTEDKVMYECSIDGSSYVLASVTTENINVLTNKGPARDMVLHMAEKALMEIIDKSPLKAVRN